MAKELEMEDIFVSDGNSYTVKFDVDGLHWTPTSKGTPRTVLHEDIIRLQLGRRIDQIETGYEFQQDSDDYSFTVNFVDKSGKKTSSGYVWKIGFMVFSSIKGRDICERWVDNVNSSVEERFPVRPQTLLVLINPASGNFRGEEIYEHDVAPLFEMVGIQADVTILERGGHASEILQECNLEEISGVISVGGDGTFSDCCNGLLRRAAKEAGVSLDDPRVKLSKAETKIGIIPAGTGNMMPFQFYRTRDARTAALNIINGTSFLGDVVSDHCDEKFISTGTLSASLGIFSDMLVEREKIRAAGKTGLATLGMLKPLWSPRKFRVQVQVLKEDGDEDNKDDWELITLDEVVEVMCFMGELGNTGWFPGYLPVTIIKPYGKWNCLKMMRALNKSDPSFKTLPQMINRKTMVYRVDLPDLDNYLKQTEDTLKGASEKNSVTKYPSIPGSVVSNDGEIFPLNNHIVTHRLHENVVPLFGKKSHPEYVK